MNWLAFLNDDRDTLAAWEASATACLHAASPEVAAVRLALPDEEAARFSLENNIDLTGSVGVSFSDGDSREFEIPLPFHGVFVTHGSAADSRNAPQRMVWSSWLGEMPGLRRVVKPNGKEELRLGLPDGRFIAIGGKKFSESDQAEIEYARWWAGMFPGVYGGELACGDIAAWAVARQMRTWDADDLGHRMAVTFPVWLRNRLLRLCYRLFVAQKSGRDGWEDVAAALVPIASAGGRRFSGFDVIRPDNILDAAARICGIRRFRASRSRVGFLPAEFRQNHPSFKGRICPIESPESEMVGIQLQLARGAWVDSTGQIVAAEGPMGGVSWCTSLIPFLNHNDDARSMMGAKNMRQGVPVSGAEPPRVRSGGEEGIVAFMRPLERAGLCPKCSDGGELKIGRDLLVAYLPWYGWNLDDAVVVSDAIVKEMSVVEERECVGDVAPEWQCTSTLEPGARLSEGTVIAEFRMVRDGRERTHAIRYVDAAPATLVQIECPPEIRKAPHERAPGFVGRLKYRIARTFALEPGDKLMGRHGNKGVVSRVLPAREMPKLPDETPVDILLNPHGVLSRMNPGQLLETHLGWLFHHGKTDADVLKDVAGTAGPSVPHALAGAPCCGAIDHEKVKRLLGETDLDGHGRAHLHWTLPNGRKVTTASPVVVGYQHFFRLHHIPALKAQARRGGKDALYSCATGQAAHGRLIGGGQRVGEMEMWALAAYPGSEPIIADLLRNSDAVAVNGTVKPALGQTGFSQVLSAHLAAMLIKMDVDAEKGTVSFSRMTDDELLGRIGLGKEADRRKRTVVKSSAVSVCSAQFSCPTDSELLAFGGERFTWKGADDLTALKLASLLARFGVAIDGPLEEVNGCYRVRVAGAPCEHLKVTPLWGRKRESATTLSLEVNASALGIDGVGDVRCFVKRKAKAGEVLRRMCLDASHGQTESIGDAQVLCPCEKCSARKPGERFKLRAENVRNEMSQGGVCDPAVFGSLREAFVCADDEKWGVIELPEPIAYPAAALTGRKMPGQPKLRYVPVPPLRYRVGYEGDEDPLGYGEVVAACEWHAKANAKGEKAKALAQIARAVADVFKALRDAFCGKHGLVRREGLGRRVDRSCRMVITPGPDLAFDEVGVPPSILWELLADRVTCERITVEGKPQSVDLRETARGETSAGFGWRSPKASLEKSVSEKAALLEAHLKEHPLWMLMNRQPSLHKYSMQAFRVKVMKPEDGEVFRLQPLSCRGFGADFDGDEMAGYLPLSDTAQRAMPRLAPSANLLSAGDLKMIPNYDRDFVTGLYLGCGRDPKAAKLRLAERCADGDAESVLRHAREAFAKCTEEGVSFGYYDIAAYDGKNGFVADMVNSGANGAKQIGQFTSARGRLETGRLGFEPKAYEEAGKFGIEGSLVGGMSWDDVFWSSFNARASMCDKKLNTGKAGDLTRRLVYALRPVKIEIVECPNPKGGRRSTLSCGCEGGVCAACYGRLPDGSPPEVGYPAGLVAAQSIGERGTQLSMKSAHAGERLVDIEFVRKLIIKGETAGKKVRTYDEFYNCLCYEDGKETPYCGLDPRHIQLLWRVLVGSAGKSLDGALKAVDGGKDMESLARRANKAAIGRMLSGEMRDVPLDSPSAQVMFNSFGISEAP